MIKIDRDKCVGCGGCIDLCPMIAISMFKDKAKIDNTLCVECKICVRVCPVKAPTEIV